MEPAPIAMIDYIKTIINNIYLYYCLSKILNIQDNKLKNNIILFIINFVVTFIYINIRNMFISFLPFLALCCICAIVFSAILRIKLGVSLIATILSYALISVFHVISVVIQFIPYKLLYEPLKIDNVYISLVIISAMQFAMLYGFFKIKRFKNGFSFLNVKLNNDITEIIVINISTLVVVAYCLVGTYYEKMRATLTTTFATLGIVMFFTIKKMFTMYYKQKLLTDTMDEYKKELVDKQNEIDRLKAEKTNISKITHDFYNRQKALELLVASNMNKDNLDKENVSSNVLKIIESLTNEYAQRFEDIKELPKLDKTDIVEIDNMFKYMQSECNKNNIDFKLKISGNIHSLVNNIINKNKLETLIGDHLRDAINAVNLINDGNKEIMAILSIKNKKYELSILDTGIDFEIDTLLKLGLKRVTTNKERGGTGIGFMTTFETMKETKASLIISEYPINKDRYYSKCITIRFDGKNQYKICSHRANEINEHAKDNRIKIEEYKKNK